MRRVGFAVLGAGVLTTVLVALKSLPPVRPESLNGPVAGGAAAGRSAAGDGPAAGGSATGGSVPVGSVGGGSATGGAVGGGAAGRGGAGASKAPGAPGAPGTPGVGVVDLHRMMDGTHLGATFTNPYGPVQVRIEVRGGRLVDVVPVRLPTAAARGIEIGMRAGPVLREQALQRQSADLDTVSGATYTSDGYRRSLQSALDAARTGRPAA
ncbi:FMN-binding protein [Dactylosporangium aurantiacum]|uniref:FMN-binding protein n=1 Tax=Dactylosporangium aurantiacum TaxID=35754 RepID=A0A9Q9IP69_9ACTN|nr:FMN-binding protein [Dactylosporangium aurantiacum]MDG6104272.1 FMN-binding protein [Dactylosporangium aurantiacum]UWZ56730.1 FMN-binding protein [Dactylosporangium aurantiacum]